MYVIREVVHCKPGKVGQMVEKFKAIAAMAGCHDLVSAGTCEIYKVES